MRSHRKLPSLALALALAGALPSAAWGQSERYRSATFGYSVDLAAVGPQFQAVASPDGVTLTSPDGRAVINVFGSWNDAGRSLSSLVEQFRHDLPGAEFTYEWRGTRSAVLSGYQAGDIFYVRLTMSPDASRVAVLNMIYAPELKRQLDPVVTRLSNSLSIR